MRKGVIAAGVIITILLVIWLTPRRTTIGDKTFQLKAPSSSTAGSSNYPASPVGQSKYPQIDPRSLSTEQIAAEVKRRDSEDAKWEWKVPIRFFGRTVDERLLPVAGAEIHFQWTDLSNHGTSQTTGSSDDRGFFSLSNIHGKRLVIRVRKDGYYSSDQENQVSFEFANPFEETYYQANPDNPVLFQLRKKGQGTELQKKSVEVVLPGDGSSRQIELTTGNSQSAAQLQIGSWKPWPPRPMSPHYDWKVTLTIPDGGFVEAHEEFPFEAPETVYEPTFEINMPASLGNAWKVSAEKTLYFVYGNPKKYGRLNLRTDGNSRYVFIDYVLNPSGSRNLEEATATTTKTR